MVIRSIELLRQVPWSTMVAEQLHSSAAVLAKFHPEYELPMLLSRCVGLFMNKLVRGKSKAERKLDKLQVKLKKNKSRKPRSLGGTRRSRCGSRFSRPSLFCIRFG